MDLAARYLERTEFDSYEDFHANLKLNVPEDFDYTRDVVDEWARMEPERRALVYCGDDGCERTFSFADISSLSKRAATYFSRLGICAGDRVVLLLRRRWEYWVCAVALHRLGAVPAPASVQMTAKDIAYRVNCCRAPMVIALSDPHVLEETAPLFELCPSLRTLVAVGGGAPEQFRDFSDFMDCPEYEGCCGLKNSDEFIIYFTSGTSGYPKMAVHDRTYPLGHIITAKYMQCVQNGGLHLTQSDSGWAKFGWGNLYGQWICGSAVLAYDPARFSAKNLLAAIKHFRPSSLCIPPTMYRFLLHGGLTREDVASIQWYSTAGEALSGEVNREFERITGSSIHEGFGQSESTPITCTFPWLEVKPSSMGRPSPLYDVRLLRADGSFCERGEEGEVVILTDENTVGLLVAYGDGSELRDPAADGVYHTGDLAYEDEDGYFWYVGRNDDMIKCSGYRIGPFEIESVLNTHPAVRESAIIAYPDSIRGQVVCAAVVLRRGILPSAGLTSELQSYVKENTAPYKYPRVVRYLRDLPKTVSGKIIRRGLCAAILSGEGLLADDCAAAGQIS